MKKTNKNKTLKKKKYGFKRFLLEALILCVGNALYALAADLFVIPSGMVMGGMTGVGILINKFFSVIPISAAVFVLNILLLIAGGIIIGKHFFLTTVASSILYPVFLEIFDRMLKHWPQINKYFAEVHKDYTLCALAAGIMIGFAVGILVRIGSSTGGSDIPPMIVTKLTGFPVGIGMLIFNGAIVASQLFTSNLRQALYGVIVIVIYSFIIDQVVVMGRGMVQLKVVSEKTDEIRKAILTNSVHGVTLLSAKKGLSGEPSELVMSVVFTRELAYFKKLILSEDPTAFIIITRVSEVNGNGFSYHKDDKKLDKDDIK